MHTIDSRGLEKLTLATIDSEVIKFCIETISAVIGWSPSAGLSRETLQNLVSSNAETIKSEKYTCLRIRSSLIAVAILEDQDLVVHYAEKLHDSARIADYGGWANNTPEEMTWLRSNPHKFIAAVQQVLKIRTEYCNNSTGLKNLSRDIDVRDILWRSEATRDAISWLENTRSACMPDQPAGPDINRDNEWIFWDKMGVFQEEIVQSDSVQNVIRLISYIKEHEERIFRGYNYGLFSTSFYNSDFRSEFPWRTSQIYMRLLSKLYDHSASIHAGDILSLAREIFLSRDELIRSAGAWQVSRSFLDFVS